MAVDLTRRNFLALTTVALGTPWLRAAEEHKMPSVPADLDHMLLGVSDLDKGIEWFEKRSGVRAVAGGVHPGRGTRNALLALGLRRYLEIIAPDPQQAGTPASKQYWAARLPPLQEPRLIGWAAHTGDLAAIARNAAAAGIATDEPRDGSRARPDGKVLRWKSFGLKDDRNGLLPFFIEWSRDTVHPSQDAPSGCKLLGFIAESPHAEQVSSDANRLGVEFAVRRGQAPLFLARIHGKKGEFEIS
jgi:Glyoxalase-like domain